MNEPIVEKGAARGGGKMFRVIIAGGRKFNNFFLLCVKCDEFLAKKVAEGWDIEIVEGGAKGADRLGRMYCEARGYYIKTFDAEWDKYGKAAGPKRNQQMADYGDALIAFWDGASPGTKDMIDKATEKGLLVRVVNYTYGVYPREGE